MLKTQLRKERFAIDLCSIIVADTRTQRFSASYPSACRQINVLMCKSVFVLTSLLVVQNLLVVTAIEAQEHEILSRFNFVEA